MRVSSSARRKKRVLDRAQARHRHSTGADAPDVSVPTSDVSPSDLLARLLPRAIATPQEPRGRLYFSTELSPTRQSSTHDTDLRRGAGNQDHADSSAVNSLQSQECQGSTKSDRLLTFQKKYGKDDELIDYALRVVRDGLAVRRSEIPRDKKIHGKQSRGQSTPEDALYLTYSASPPCGFRNVYWLSFIDEDEAVDPELHQRDYFSLTCRGLTHFESGAATEFIDVASWVHEKRAFDHMTSMRGLARIQQMLFFFSWKRKAIKNKHKRVRARLRESLFSCHKVASRVLQGARAQCLEIEEWGGPKTQSNETPCSLSQFRKLHQDNLDAARVFIHTKIESICDIVSREACQGPQPVMRSVGYTPTNLVNLTSQLEAASLRERMFQLLRLIELKLTEAIRAHSIEFLRGVCKGLCGKRNDDGKLKPPYSSPKPFPDAPLLYAQIVDAISTDEHISGVSVLQIQPTKEDVLEVLHTIFAQYLSAMDSMPSLLMSARFQHVLTPFEPSFRANFCNAFKKPSSLTFEACVADLSRMRDTVNECYQSVERVRVDHLRCIRAIKIAESTTAETDSALMLSTTASPSGSLETNTSSATAHEAALKTWSRFMQYAESAGAVLNIGFLLVDQQEFVMDLKDRVARHLAQMNELLPKEYQALLQLLVNDVDARIDRVTKVPGTLESAMLWIDQVTEMLPTHSLRQLFDAKCRNLARLKVLVKERTATRVAAAARIGVPKHEAKTDGTSCHDTTAVTLHEQQQQLENSILKLEVAWESLYETLLMCLERVQDRNGMHRRSIEDLMSNTEEYIGDQMHHILTIFGNLSTGIEERSKSLESASQTEIVNRLEELVELDMERSRVVKCYTTYEREYRMVSELPRDQWVTTLRCANVRSGDSMHGPNEKLPTEMLLQYVVTAFELRHWYASWLALQSKWRASPLVQIHPGAILDRIKQFRKRVAASARRMHKLSSALLKTPVFVERAAMEETSSPFGFASSDFALIRAFRASIDDIAWYSKAFQAINGGSFADHHWEQLEVLIPRDRAVVGVLDRDQFTLQQLLAAFPSESVHAEHGRKDDSMRDTRGSGDLNALMEFFDDCIVESRLHAQLERARKRLSRVCVQICEENYTVRCDGVDEALRELDNILMEVKLCLYQQNPELQACVELCADVESQMTLCEFVLQFQRKWLSLFDWLKLHDVEDFIASQHKSFATSSASGGPSTQTVGYNDESVWKALTSSSQRWADVMRRIYFTRPQAVSNLAAGMSPTVLMPSKKAKLTNTRVGTKLLLLSTNLAPENDGIEDSRATKKRNCSLVELACGFQDFDFESEITSCEQGLALVRGYLCMLRETSPRLLLVEDPDLLHLLTHDQDIIRFHYVLSRCFPHVSRFSIKRFSRHFDHDLDGSAPTSDNMRISDNTASSILVDGIIDMRGVSATAWSFRMPVTKIGRIKFWLSRIEEEVTMMVRGNLREALRWVMSSAEVCPHAEARTSDTLDETSPQLPLLPQSIVIAAIFRFTYEVARLWTGEKHGTSSKSTIDVIRRFSDLSRRQEARMSELIAIQRDMLSCGSSTESCTRQLVNIENLLLLLHFQGEVAHQLSQLLRAQRDEDAHFFWSMQYKVYMCQLSTSTGTSSTTSEEGGRQGNRAHRVELPLGIDESINDMKRRDLEAAEVYAQVAHIELAIGHEFTGWSRIPVLSPLSQRCAFALLSAARSQKHLGVIAPYSVHSNDVSSTLAAVSGLAQLLMTPMLHFKCSPGQAHTHGDITRLEAHLHATFALSAMLVIHDFALLNRANQRLIQERLIRWSSNDPGVATQGSATQSSVVMSASVRFNGGPPCASPAIIIPFTTHRDLQQSGLLDTIQRRVRAVAVPPVAIRFLVESLLLPYGYSRDQALRSGVISAFEALAALIYDFESKSGGVSVRAIIPKVIGDAMRLRAAYRVILTPILDERIPRHSAGPSPSDDISDSEARERCTDQTIFRISLLENIKLLLTGQHRGNTSSKALAEASMITEGFFPYANRTRAALQLKRSDADEDVANAIEISLEESGLASRSSQHRQMQQFDRIMDLWKVLQIHDGVIVHGPPGSGKSTIIKVLHRALTGLALASNMDDTDASKTSNDIVYPDTSTFNVLNAGILSLDQLHDEISRAINPLEVPPSTTQSPEDADPNGIKPPKWVVVDGVLDSRLLERVMALSVSGERNSNDPDERNPDTAVSRFLARSVHANGFHTCRSRIIFEAIDLCSLSPFSLTHCYSIYIAGNCITHEDIVFTWKHQWERRLRIIASADRIEQCGDAAAPLEVDVGSQRLFFLFKVIDALLLDVCIPFVESESAHQESPENFISKSPNTLAGLSITHMTSTALTMLALWSFSRSQSWRSDESLLLPPAILAEMVAFAMLWGFAGHLPHTMQHKLEFFLRSKLKDSLELRHLSEASGSLFDPSRFDEWSPDDEGGRGISGDTKVIRTMPPSYFEDTMEEDGSSSLLRHTVGDSILDPSSGHLIALCPVTLPLIRICSRLIHAGSSFMLIGPAASGKTSVLRWLLRTNDEAQAAETMVDRALDQQQTHAILDWLSMPASWFDQPTTASIDYSGPRTILRTRAREESKLFSLRASCSFVFVDDLCVDNIRTTGVWTDSSAKTEYLRSILDHRVCFSRQHSTFLRVSAQVGAAMRISEDAAHTKRIFPSTMSRLLRHFTVLHTPEYSQKDLLSVFRTKFHAHFAYLSKSTSVKSSYCQKKSTSSSLTAEEILLRASADWMTELSALRDTIQVQGFHCMEALTFNWHHLSAILARSLPFACGLSSDAKKQSRDRNNPATLGTSERQAVTLVDLGRLHQSWISELENEFLINWPRHSVAQPASRHEQSSGASLTAPASDEFETVSKKVWTIVRLLSEKYFSATMQDETTLPVSVATAYFSMQLAVTHPQAPLLEAAFAVEIRDLLTALASAAPSVGSPTRSTRGSVVRPQVSSPVPDECQPVTERIVSMLVELASVPHGSENRSASNRFNVASHHKRESSVSSIDLKIRLMLSSPTILNQCLHISRALDPSTSQASLVVLSTRNGLALAHRLATFACNLHGFQVHSIDQAGFQVANKDQHGRNGSSALSAGKKKDMRSILIDILFAVGVRQKRIAIWVNWADLFTTDRDYRVLNDGDPWKNSAVPLLLSLMEELCLGQLPTLVLDQGYATSGIDLRDAILMGCIQNKTKMETATEEELLQDFNLRIQRNLRICVFDTVEGMLEVSGLRETMTLDKHEKTTPRINTLAYRMRARASCKRLKLEIKDHQIIRIMSSVAEKARMLAAPCNDEALAVLSCGRQPRCPLHIPPDCLVRLHQHAMMIAMTPVHTKQIDQVLPEHSIEYFLSFMVNLHAQWRRVSEQETNINTRHQQAIERFECLMTKFLPQVDARRELLDTTIQQLFEKELDDSKAMYPVLQLERAPSDDTLDDTISLTEALAEREYYSWCCRTQREERDMMRCELQEERQALIDFMDQWQQVLPRAKALVEKCRESVEVKRTTQYWNKRLGEAILRAVGVTYPFLWLLEGDYKVHSPPSASGINRILKEYGFYEPDIASSELNYDARFDENLLDSVESDVATLFLATLLMKIELPLLRHRQLMEGIRIGCDVADRVPVFVDPLGIFQRLFVRCFSGESLLETMAGSTGRTKACHSYASDEVRATSNYRSHHVSRPEQTIIVSCNDHNLHAHLVDAQRRNLPVLLLDFSPNDRLCAILSPFLGTIRRRAITNAHRSSTTQLCTLLEILAVQGYYEYTANRTSRRNIRRTASTTIGSAGSAMNAGAACHSSLDVSPSGTTLPGVTVASSPILRNRNSTIDKLADPFASLTPVPGQQSNEWDRHKFDDHSRGGHAVFQIVAVASTDIDLLSQHRHAHAYAFYSLALDTHVLSHDFFGRLWIERANNRGNSVNHDLRATERLAADCCALVADGCEKLWTAITSKGGVTRSRFLNSNPHLQKVSAASHFEYYWRVFDALVALDQQKRCFSMSYKQLQQKTEIFNSALNGYKAAGDRMTRLARCTSVLPALLPSLLYKRSYRWLEHRVIEELAAMVPDSTDLSDEVSEYQGNEHAIKIEDVAEAVVRHIGTDIKNDLICSSHRQMLGFIETVESATRLFNVNARDSAGATKCQSYEDKPLDNLFLWRALSWLSTNEILLVAESTMQRPENLPDTSAELRISHGTTSLVDRFRRKVRLGGMLVDCFSGNSRGIFPHKSMHPHPRPTGMRPSTSRATSVSSTTSSLDETQNVRQQRRPLLQSAAISSSFALNAAVTTAQKDESDELEKILATLFKVVEDYWTDWKAAKLERRRGVERLLSAHGIRRARRASLRQLEITAAATVSASASTSGDSDASVSSSETMRVKTPSDVLAEFNVFDTSTSEGDKDGNVDHSSMSDALAKFLLISAFFPDAFAEAAMDWRTVIMALCHPSSSPRSSIAAKNNVTADLECYQGSDTSSLVEQSRFARLADLNVSSPSFAALVTDVSPSFCWQSVASKAGKSPLVLLPKCLIVYGQSTDHGVEEIGEIQEAQRLAEQYFESVYATPLAPNMLTWWSSSIQIPTTSSEDASARYYYDQLVALITSTSTTAMSGSKQARRVFAIHLLDPTQFDTAVAMISHAVSEHALLVAPEWIVLCSLNVATRITSNKLPLLPRVFMNSTSSTVNSTAITQATSPSRVSHSLPSIQACYLVNTIDADTITEHLSWLQSSLSAHNKSECENAQTALMRCLTNSNKVQRDEGADEEEERVRNHEEASVRILEAASERSAAKSSIGTSPAALASDLMANIVAARSSILSMMRENSGMESTETSYLSQAAQNRFLQRIDILFQRLRQTADALSAAMLVALSSSPSKAMLFPWHSLQCELEMQSMFFRELDKNMRALLSPVAPSVDPTHSTAIACVLRGFIPLTWIAAALDTASRGSCSLPSWPQTQMPIAQLALLLAYRFALLADWLSSENRRRLTRTLDLAGIHDATGLLRALRRHVSKCSSVPMRNVTLVLIQEEGDEGPGVEENTPSELGAVIRRRQSDGTTVVIGLRVEGVVLMELKKSPPNNEVVESSAGTVIAIHTLPPCRLVCRVNSDDLASRKSACEDQETASESSARVDKRRLVPLVALASLSPFFQPKPRPWSTLSSRDERIDWVELGLELSAIGVSLVQGRHQVLDQADQANDQDEDEVELALGVPFFATDESIPSAS